MMKAIRPAAAFFPAALVSVFALLAVGCGDFWLSPNGNGSTGTTASTTTLSAAESSITAGTADELSASVSPTAATGTVNFLNSGSSIGTETLTSGAATDDYTFATAGTYTITAEYSGDDTYASSTSTAVSITVTAAAADSLRPAAISPERLTRKTNLVLDPANVWPVPATVHLHNVAGLVLNGQSIQNIDDGGHCVFYSGTLYFVKSAETPSSSQDSKTAEAKRVYDLPSGGVLAPEGTSDLDCQ